MATRAILLLMLAAGAAWAQGGKKPVFEVPAPETEPQRDETDERDDSLQRTLNRLSGWPAARARRAAERLIVQKERSLPYVEAVLVSGEAAAAPLKPGAAYVLGRIGDGSHVLSLLLTAAERDQQRHAETFLEAAWRLDPEAAVAEAFRFFHLAETTLRHEAVRFVLDRVTADNLEQIDELLDRRTAERAFTREIGLRLLDRLVQTGQAKWADVGPRFYAALGDESPQVASRVMRLLASREDKENIATLNGLITKEMSYWRQRSYAALSLALLSSAYRVQPFEPETIAVLHGPKGLYHPKEMLARASSAYALAQVALRTNEGELVKLLDKEIPILLIDAVGASNRHYRDFASVMPLAYQMLRRITGQAFPDHAPVWAQWWQDHGRTFRARRELVEVARTDLPDTEIEITAPRSDGGRRVRLAAVGENRPTFLHGRAYAVPEEELGALVTYLRDTGFFRTREADPAEADPESALVVMRVGDLDRKVAYETGETAIRIRDAILDRVDALTRAYAWQLWWDVEKQPSWRLFFLENRKWFAEHEDPAVRAARLRRMITGALNDLVAVDDRLYAVEYLADLPGGGGALTPEEVAALVDSVAVERAANAYVEAVVALLVPDAGPDAVAGLIDALADKIGPSAQALLVRLCTSLPADRVAALADDERWKVRRAAVLALADRDDATAVRLLTDRLADGETAVRLAAAEALARKRNPAVMPALADLSSPAMAKEVRGTAAFAYGVLGTPESREALRPLLFDDPNAEVKIRGIRGLEESGDLEAVPLLLEVFDKISDRLVRSAAATAIVGLESPELVDRLIARLQMTDATDPERVALVNVLARFESDKPRTILRAVLMGDDVLSADAAALGLARRWDDTALVQLIAMIKRGGSTTRTAVRHLQILTSTSFDSPSYERQAENYEGWATARGTGNPREWFREALDFRGYPTAGLEEWAGLESKPGVVPPVPDEAVDVLLRALRDRDWFIRRNASFLLAQRMGDEAAGVIDVGATNEEEEAIIAACHRWWAAIVEEREKRRRG